MTDLGVPLEELGLTPRPYNCLQRAGIHTLGELLQLSEFDLWELRNFGAKSVHEVKMLLSELGLSLSDTLPSFFTEAPARLTLTGEQFRDALANAYNKGFNDAEEQHDGFTGVSGWTNHNPYSRSNK